MPRRTPRPDGSDAAFVDVDDRAAPPAVRTDAERRAEALRVVARHDGPHHDWVARALATVEDGGEQAIGPNLPWTALTAAGLLAFGAVGPATVLAASAEGATGGVLSGALWTVVVGGVLAIALFRAARHRLVVSAAGLRFRRGGRSVSVPWHEIDGAHRVPALRRREGAVAIDLVDDPGDLARAVNSTLPWVADGAGGWRWIGIGRPEDRVIEVRLLSAGPSLRAVESLLTACHERHRHD